MRAYVFGNLLRISINLKNKMYFIFKNYLYIRREFLKLDYDRSLPPSLPFHTGSKGYPTCM